MRLDKLTHLFQQALADAQSLALGRDHQVIEPEHVLLAMLAQEGGSIVAILQQAGANIALLTDELQKSIDHFPKVEGAPGQVHVSNSLAQLLNRCDQLAQQKKDQFTCAFYTSELSAYYFA
jgi:ATP-dependent Clp protease ATP-binding subunit ClpB